MSPPPTLQLNRTFETIHAGKYLYFAAMRFTYIILASLILVSCQQKTTMDNLTAHAFRLKPGQDLKTAIQELVNEKQIKAG
ncbi:MAG: hypothetical protein ABIR78_05715 [Ferruginibacter sp.]